MAADDDDEIDARRADARSPRRTRPSSRPSPTPRSSTTRTTTRSSSRTTTTRRSTRTTTRTRTRTRPTRHRPPAPSGAAARGEEDEDEDDDLLSPDDVEADLDRILKDRLVTAEEDEDEDEEEPDDRGEQRRPPAAEAGRRAAVPELLPARAGHRPRRARSATTPARSSPEAPADHRCAIDDEVRRRVEATLRRITDDVLGIPCATIQAARRARRRSRPAPPPSRSCWCARSARRSAPAASAWRPDRRRSTRPPCPPQRRTSVERVSPTVAPADTEPARRRRTAVRGLREPRGELRRRPAGASRPRRAGDGAAPSRRPTVADAPCSDGSSSCSPSDDRPRRPPGGR